MNLTGNPVKQTLYGTHCQNVLKIYKAHCQGKHQGSKNIDIRNANLDDSGDPFVCVILC